MAIKLRNASVVSEVFSFLAHPVFCNFERVGFEWLNDFAWIIFFFFCRFVKAFQ